MNLQACTYSKFVYKSISKENREANYGHVIYSSSSSILQPLDKIIDKGESCATAK